MFSSLSTLLRVLVASAASFPFVAAEFTTDQFNTKISATAAPPGYNVQGGSVFKNFVNALNDRQIFVLRTDESVLERPESDVVNVALFNWCSDLTFSDASNSSRMGYAARCVQMVLAGYAEALAAGSQVPFFHSEGKFTVTGGISAVFVEQLNVFEGQIHYNTDNLVHRYWDDGQKVMPQVAWEDHDEGDMHPNAATSSFSTFGEFTWVSVEEVAQLFNTSTDEFTPVKFKQVYEDTWIEGHEKEAATDNPNAGAELEIVEQVKNETDSTGETTTPAEPADTKEDGGTDGADPIDDSASGRKLASVAARFVSAALRVFGI